MDKNEFRHCILLLIDNGNHSKIFVSKKNMYYIKNNKSIRIKIFNKFKDIKTSYGVIVNDITDNYYKIDSSSIIKSCIILLIDDDDHFKIFISEKNLYYTNNDGYYEIGDDDDDDKLYYKYLLNDFEHLVSVKNNIVNLINNDNNHKHKLTLLGDNINIFVCKNAY